MTLSLFYFFQNIFFYVFAKSFMRLSYQATPVLSTAVLIVQDISNYCFKMKQSFVISIKITLVT